MTTRILILGISGMLGHTLYRKLREREELTVFGTLRNPYLRDVVSDSSSRASVFHNVTVENFDSVVSAVASAEPDLIINCIGLIKQLHSASNPLVTIPINALLPHRLAKLCQATRTRLIHFSTDCIFSGRKGNYNEDDVPDADDLYGRSKLLGEVEGSHVVTLRTSIIGHELRSSVSLINWFLTQRGPIKGYSSAIYSGLPTVEMARILAEIVIPNSALNGLYHVSSRPISKLELLKMVARQYGKTNEIIPDSRIKIDRSLDSTRFTNATGYTAPSWSELVASMHKDYLTLCR